MKKKIKEWITSGIFFVNDIIDNNSKITQEFILHKLKNKSNWISEFSILKKAFPKNWIDILKTESSVKSIVNIKKIISSGTISLLIYLHCLISYYIINW